MEERKLNPNEKEFKIMMLAKEIFEYLADGCDVRFCVRDTYFDRGLNWMWTTILVDNHRGDEFQMLSPREWKEILHAGYVGIGELGNVCEKIFVENIIKYPKLYNYREIA